VYSLGVLLYDLLSDVKVWDLTTDVHEVFACAARTPGPLLSRDGRRLATLDDIDGPGDQRQREVIVWDVDARSKPCVVSGRILNVWFSPDGRRIAIRLSSEGRPAAFAAFNAPAEVTVYHTDTGGQLPYLS
jgi:dipeptidyl aminopeptidase/acylaminoacyl peptidase